ncbi:hypothetical protein J1614_002357 [Plenodomus biglobosus]|nr:hypothetical protein J1614_002357 [Plenodomus biglobosus]
MFLTMVWVWISSGNGYRPTDNMCYKGVSDAVDLAPQNRQYSIAGFSFGIVFIVVPEFSLAKTKLNNDTYMSPEIYTTDLTSF